VVGSGPAATGYEADPEAQRRADDGEDADMLHLARGQGTAGGSRRLVTLNFEAEIADPDLGGLGPGEIPDQTADHEADEEETDPGVQDQAAAAIFFAFSLASSMVPTM